MKPHLACSALIFLCCHLAAQTITHAWSYGWGSTDFDPTPIITVDQAGNVFSAAFFDTPLDVDPGPGMVTITPTPFTRESYITMIDSAGQFQWVIILRSSSIINIRDILADRQGNLLCTGDFSGTADFDPGPGMFQLTSTGSASEVFVLKLSADGHFIWANATQGTGQKYGYEIATDSMGFVYCAGIFTGSGDFDTGSGTEIFTAAGFVDGFVSKFDADGQFIWSRHHAGNFQVGIFALDVDSKGNIYFGGAFDDRRDFDPGPDSLILTATGAWDAFFEKWDTDGNLLWVHTYSNGADNYVFDMKVDTADQLFITGYYSGTLDFDPGPQSSSHTAILFDTYVAKYNTNGDWIWDAVFEGSSYDRGNAMQIDRNGSVYTTGFFGEQVDFDPGPNTYMLTSTGDSDTDDAFVSVLDADGRFVFARQIGGTANDVGTSLDLDRWGNILVAGGFGGTAGFYPDDSAPDSIQSKGGTDLFLLRWRQCLPTKAVVNAVSCDDLFVSPSGKYQWVMDGTYQDTLVNQAGCDSLLTIHLTFEVLNTAIGVIPELDFLTAVEENATYQWVDCADGYTWIAGETSRMFTPQTDGQYAVILDNGFCRDTSDCWDWIVSGNVDIHTGDFARIFPNPVSDKFYLDFQHPPGQVIVTLYAANGQLLMTQNLLDDRHAIDVADQLPGLFYVQIQTDTGVQFGRLIKI